ncbi:MAG: uncharacterized protein QG673_1995 [Pseudomonadota bacterium]|nr:uncharacterized protein [Pseudomonadota bacterium]
MKNILNCWAISLILLLAACANNPLGSYTSNMSPSLLALSNGNSTQAENKISGKNDLLYYLEHGTVLRLSDKYTQSNSDFSFAQQYIDQWAASFHNGNLGLAADTLEASLVNDKVIDYAAKDYEKVMLPTYKALNYMALGDIDSARIEITRMYNIEDIIHDYREAVYAKTQSDVENSNPKKNTSFATFEQVESINKGEYDFEALNSPQVLALKNSYQNSFSHYLAGFIFEALQEPSLARPGYVKALELNPGNKLIKQSIDNVDKASAANNNNMTDLLIIEEVGHAPQLKSVSFSVPFFTTSGQNKCSKLITISFPQLVFDAQNHSAADIGVDGQSLQPMLFTNFDLMASRYLHDNLPNIYLRNTLRAAKDLALQQSVCSEGGGIASLITTIGTKFLGTADERTWVTLPRQIYVTRIKMTRGKHNISVNVGGAFKQIRVNLTKSYAVLSLRIIGNSVYFSPEQNK